MFKDRGFSFDLTGVKESPYRRVFLSLDTEYGDGGWKNLEEKKKFETVVYPALKDAGYVLLEPEMSGKCPEILFHHMNRKLTLYLHPQEFSGYVPQKDLERIMEILREKCGSVVYGMELLENEPTYDISEAQYEKMIVEKASEIVRCVKEEQNSSDRRSRMFMQRANRDMDEIGFQFARECRIPIAGGPRYSSFNNVDVHTVSMICKVAKNLNLFDKEQKLSNDMEADRERD